jgi:hypothetical protein
MNSIRRICIAFTIVGLTAFAGVSLSSSFIPSATLAGTTWIIDPDVG